VRSFIRQNASLSNQLSHLPVCKVEDISAKAHSDRQGLHDDFDLILIGANSKKKNACWALQSSTYSDHLP
jgi:hypothetical protein